VAHALDDHHQGLGGIGLRPGQAEEAVEAEVELPEGYRLQARLTRAELEALIRPVLERTSAACRAALRDARIDRVGGVVLVGGTTRTPLVRRHVRDLFGMEPLADIDPDTVVALGAGQDRTALELLATASGGRAYFVEDVRELPATVMREASRVAGGRTVEAPFAARPSAHAILNGIDMTRPPRLGGYVVTAARSGSEVVLSSHLGDPLLAVWPRGLGRVGVYTGDLHSAWSSRLTHWGGFGQLFRQTVRWTSRRLDHPLLHAALRRVGGELVLEVEAGDDRTRPRPLDVRGTLRAPAGRSLELLFEPAGPGRYEAHAPLREQGTYLANLSAKSSDGTLDGALLRGFHWSASGEREPRDADVALLVELAAMTGGQVLEPGATALPPREPGFADGRPWLMSAALAIFLLDAVLEGVAGSLAAAWSRRLVAGPLEQSA